MDYIKEVGKMTGFVLQTERLRFDGGRLLALEKLAEGAAQILFECGDICILS